MKKWLPLLAVSLGTFMLLLDVTIVNVALPSMAGSLGATFAELQWVIDVYALALAALLLGVGSIADAVGRRRIYLGGLVLFAVASAVCGAAPDPATLIAARAVQGVGAAAMFATTIALLTHTYRGRDLGTAFGVWGAVSGAAAATGPIIGGLLTEAISWRWVFFVNLPVCAAAVALTLRAFAADRPERRVRLDLPGMATFTAGASLLTFAAIRANEAGWTSAQTLGLLGLAALSLAAFAELERRSAAPMLDLALLRHGPFTGSMLGAALLSASAFGVLAYTSIWLQSVVGLSALQAGLVFLPLSGSAFLVSAAIGRFLHDGHARWTMSGGLLLIGVGGLLQASLDARSGWGALTLGLLLVGVGVGLASPSLISTAMASAPHRQAAMASGAVNTGRQLGLALGLAVIGSVFASRVASAFESSAVAGAGEGTAHAVSGGGAQAVLAAAPGGSRAALDELIHGAVASGLHGAYLLAGALGLVGAVAVAVLVRPEPAGRRESAGEAVTAA